MSDLADVEDELKKLQIASDTGSINIILFGDTGVNKAVFINAFANYLTYASLETAQEEKLFVLAPFECTMTADDGLVHRIVTGVKDKEAYQNKRVSSTQEILSYVFPIGSNQSKIRIIDTPDMENITEIDDINCENILNYTNSLHQLHAICFLFSVPSTRNNCLEYYVKQFFSRLHKSACKNIVFIFTNTTDSMTDDIKDCVCSLRKTADEIRQKYAIEIPLKNNIFHVNYDAFKYLVAYKNDILNTVLEEGKAQQGWWKSMIQSWR